MQIEKRPTGYGCSEIYGDGHWLGTIGHDPDGFGIYDTASQQGRTSLTEPHLGFPTMDEAISTLVRWVTGSENTL